jgi:putative nucleotidyltransferase with HDIG domain
MTPRAPSKKLSESILEELWFGEDDAQAIDAQAAASFAAVMADLEGLRPFSDVARRVLDEVANPSFEVGHLQTIIDQDPALASKVLRLANSAAFRPREPCATIRQAIMVLGARTLGDLAMSLSMMTMFADVGGLGRAVRDHSAATGALVRALGLHRENAGAAIYIIGLLHDMGKLLLLQAQPEAYIKIHGQELREPDAIHVREREELGFDHAVLGAHMLEKWGLPDPIPKAIAWHHQPTRAYAAGGNVALTVALIRLAERIEHLLKTSGEASDEELERLTATTDCQHLGFTARDLRKFWSELRTVYQEATQLFR